MRSSGARPHARAALPALQWWGMMSLLVQVTFLPSFFLLNAHDCVGGLRNATVCCGCIYVASVNSGALGPFTPVDPRNAPLVEVGPHQGRALASPRFRVSDPQISARSSKNQAQGVQWTPAFLWRNARRR